MSEYINNSTLRKAELKELILHLHSGDTPDEAKERIRTKLKNLSAGEVAEVEQELLDSGQLTTSEIQSFCDLHHQAVEDSLPNQEQGINAPEGHPAHTFMEENYALRKEIEEITALLPTLETLSGDDLKKAMISLRSHLNMLWDVEKHYLRKEYLLFPYMEKAGVTGPPKVMWGKHDETRAIMKEVDRQFVKTMKEGSGLSDLVAIINQVLESIRLMTFKEEQILLPWCLEIIDLESWLKIYEESPEFGFCIIDPKPWKDATVSEVTVTYNQGGPIRLNSGTFDLKELEALFLHLPIDITFVDKNDKVRFFSHSAKRVFERNRSILGRDVRMCHPPGSVHIVEQIISDFKEGKEDKAVFWLSNFMGRFIYIEYTAVRSPEGEYLGVVECTQDITQLRALEGDRRLLQYEKRES